MDIPASAAAEGVAGITMPGMSAVGAAGFGAMLAVFTTSFFIPGMADIFSESLGSPLVATGFSTGIAIPAIESPVRAAAAGFSPAAVLRLAAAIPAIMLL